MDKVDVESSTGYSIGTKRTSVKKKRTANNRRTPLEKILIASSGTLLVLCFVLVTSIAVLSVSYDVRNNRQNQAHFRGRRDVGTTLEKQVGNLCSPSIDLRTTGNYCITEECVNIAHSLIQHMDRSVDPCVDFYQFSCGKWADVHPLPDEAVHYDTFAVLKQDIRLKIKDLLEEQIAEDEPQAMKMVKNFYISCMNETLISEIGEAPLLRLLNSLGGWPVLNDNWSSQNFDWVELMAQLRLYNNEILISEGIGPDKKNSSIHVIQIDQSRLGMPVPEYFLKQGRHYKAYLQYMIDTAVLLGASTTEAKKQMAEVAQFETMLSNITVKDEFRMDINQIYRKLSIEQLQVEVPQIDWLKYFNTFLPSNINKSEEIVTFSMDYFVNLGELTSQTEPRVIANYLLWRFVFNRNFNLDQRFQKIQMKYYKVLYGSNKAPSRWIKCTSYINQNMGMAIGAAFVNKHFTKGSKEEAVSMILEIQKSFTSLLEDANWMEEEAKSSAKLKVQKITEKIGYPNFILNSTLLDEYYEEYKMQPETFFENVLENLKLKSKKEHSKFNTAVDRTKWMTSPADVNAYYTRTQNMISFPAGILQPPLYSKHYPRALNFGGIGVVIGHEITHGFDDKGRQFDEDGNLNEWWQDDVVHRFEKQAECFVDQYDNYVVKQVNISVNGLRTVGENIADNGGVKQSFMAYQKWIEKNGEEWTLPGLNLTNNQLFFLNYAQVWCGTGRKEAMIYKLRTAVHTPGKYRVIGSLTNFHGFAEAFHCPVGSPMNPEKKCTIW